MPTILNLETATTNCSVSVAKDGKLLAIKEHDTPNYSHSEQLHIFIQEVLKDAKLELSDVDAIAVSKGPGSYTGLRIGVSAAKGLCFSLDLPLISVATLTSLANQVENEGTIIPMMDARRMEVYTAVFDKDKNQIEDTSAKILDAESYKKYLDEQIVYFIGSGVEKFKKICEHPNARYIEDKLPSSAQMVSLATIKHKKSDFE